MSLLLDLLGQSLTSFIGPTGTIPGVFIVEPTGTTPGQFIIVPTGAIPDVFIIGPTGTITEVFNYWTYRDNH